MCGPGFSEPQGCCPAQAPAGQRDDWGQSPPHGICVVSLCGAPHPAEGEPRQLLSTELDSWLLLVGGEGSGCATPVLLHLGPRGRELDTWEGVSPHTVSQPHLRAGGATRTLQRAACVHLGPPFFKVKLVTDSSRP